MAREKKFEVLKKKKTPLSETRCHKKAGQNGFNYNAAVFLALLFTK